YDYSARGVYFVTICTQNRVCNLGSVVGADARIGPHDGLNPDVHIELSPLGRIAEQALLQMDGLLHYVIMPNHIHFLVGIQPKADGTMQASSPTNISQVVRIFKGRVAHRAGHSVFQRSFYDHIIRTETDYWAIVQ
ncbi:MAG: hypothetical protein WAV39_10130, partial [Gemmiger qucibialis]